MENMELLPGVTLHICRDTRFKQGCLSFQMVRPMCSRESAANALLPAVLLRGTGRYPDLRAITEYLDDLYGASVSPLVRRIGDYQSTGLYCGFMDDRFALPGDKVLAPMIAFLGELLLDSPLEDGGFLPEFVEGEKKNLISAIESELNDKRAYAMSRLLKLMCRGDSFGLPRMGEVEEVAALDARELYAHYRTILRTSQIEIFYVGSEALEVVASLLMPLLRHLERNFVPPLEQTAFVSGIGDDVTETMEVTQGKLCIGFTTSVTNRDKEFAAMQVFNTLFGSGMTSKLFLQVREKQSLCYSIGSAYYSTKGIVTVSAGIDFDKREQTESEIMRQLGLCQTGDITQQELCAAKEAILSGLRSVHDTPSAIEGYYATSALSGLNMTPEEYMAEVEAVTVQDTIDAAKRVIRNTTYFLKGDNQ